jgi:hypothetical protein
MAAFGSLRKWAGPKMLPSSPGAYVEAKKTTYAGDAAGDGLHRSAIERIPIGGEGEAGKRGLPALQAPGSKATDRDTVPPRA